MLTQGGLQLAKWPEPSVHVTFVRLLMAKDGGWTAETVQRVSWAARPTDLAPKPSAGCSS